MRDANLLKFSAALSAVIASTSLVAQDYAAPRTEYGHPDFRGVWNFSSQTPLERPERYKDQEFLTPAEITEVLARREASTLAAIEREATVAEQVLNNRNTVSVGSVNNFWLDRIVLEENGRTSLIVHPRNGKLPELQDGIVVQRGDESGITEIPGTRPVRYTHGGIGRDGPEDRGLSERCIVFNSGPPLQSGPYNNLIQIFQNQDHVVILAEMGFDARIVPLEKSEHVDPAITLWSGDSRGYFENDTLVVESRNFTDKIASLGLRQEAYGSARDRLLVERFTPTADGKLNYEFTIDDPATFKDKLTVLMPMTKVDEQLYEYACHAGNYAIGNILKGARAAETSGATP